MAGCAQTHWSQEHLSDINTIVEQKALNHKGFNSVFGTQSMARSQMNLNW
jgi:hypothetical protein